MSTVLRIAARRDGFRRAGIAHPATPTDYPLEQFSAEQLAALRDEPMLSVVEIHTPVPSPVPPHNPESAAVPEPAAELAPPSDADTVSAQQGVREASEPPAPAPTSLHSDTVSRADSVSASKTKTRR